MSDPHFFGYGSLVNRHTHPYQPALPAQLEGWRRTWRSTPQRPAAFLTGKPAPGHRIAGMIAPVPGADWAALDHRERGYDRMITKAARHDHPSDPEIAVYAVPDTPWQGAPLPFLLSYLDVVIEGYLAEFGLAGVAAFFRTTDGWDAPAADDRAAPLYPRARAQRADLIALVDTWLERLNVQRIDPIETGLAAQLGDERRIA